MTRLLTKDELASLDRALDKRTGGRVRVGRKSMTRDQGIALWNATSEFVPVSPLCESSGVRRAVAPAALLAATASLSACATLGGNVKGDFTCRAPDGICAPSTTIDDAALAMISGDVGVTPAGPYAPSAETSPRTTLAASKPVRSGEKVLRIVFPAHIDGAGRFRETTAVHAVVERGAWMASNAVAVSPPRAATSADTSTGQPVDTSSVMPRSLSEFAASAPEVQFPDPIADADAQVAALEAAQATEVAQAPAVAASTTRVAKRSRRGRNSRTALVAQPSAAAPPVGSGTRVAVPPAAITHSLPPGRQATATNPMDAIRVQVAEQLRGSKPVTSPAPTRPSSVATDTVPSTKPTNAPSLFPVSGINR